ncbi:hypothetical protein [Saccharothrix sp. HUAS TT1]|uniref:hypothetical protein n=1 Tax=unclassified Saccharothrix TaxID=2593673 RepID=UPI00345C45D4
MLTRHLVAALCLALVGAASAACVPQTPFAPIAVRLDHSGAIEIWVTECDVEGVSRVEILMPNADRVVDADDPVAWRLDLDPPSMARTYVVGEIPPGARETVEWQEPPPDQRFFVQVVDGGMTTGTGFALGDLADGKVRFELKNMSYGEFLRESQC